MSLNKLHENSTVEIMKADNGVIVRPTMYRSETTLMGPNDVLVFNSYDECCTWLRKFFPAVPRVDGEA